jgi:hypothetical protein
MGSKQSRQMKKKFTGPKADNLRRIAVIRVIHSKKSVEKPTDNGNILNGNQTKSSNTTETNFINDDENKNKFKNIANNSK